jgi:predicted anti-sigma-YlaC factor YlaD
MKLSRLPLAVGLSCLCLLEGCSVKRIAVNKIGDALSSGVSSYATDDDPELIRDATPFGLKTIESLLQESPRHRGLLLSACSGFTQYGYAFVEQDADFAESKDYARATELRARARRLYKRAFDYGFRGLEVDFPGFRERLRQNPEEALARTRKEHVPLLYWTGSALGAAIAISKDNGELTAQQPQMEALMRRALALDETYDQGSIHDFFISYEGRSDAAGGSMKKAREHFEKSVALSHGSRAWTYVNLAEVVSVAEQKRKEFQELLAKALAIDPDKVPDLRLSNLIAQKRARWLQDRADELFVE